MFLPERVCAVETIHSGNAVVVLDLVTEQTKSCVSDWSYALFDDDLL